MTPSKYRDFFWKASKKIEETNVQYANMLDKLLTYYLDSRLVRESKVKKYGDILINVLTVMPEDIVEVSGYFNTKNRYFKKYEVSEEIRVSLLNPFLYKSAQTAVLNVPNADIAD